MLYICVLRKACFAKLLRKKCIHPFSQPNELIRVRSTCHDTCKDINYGLRKRSPAILLEHDVEYQAIQSVLSDGDKV